MSNYHIDPLPSGAFNLQNVPEDAGDKCTLSSSISVLLLGFSSSCFITTAAGSWETDGQGAGPGWKGRGQDGSCGARMEGVGPGWKGVGPG